MQDRSSDVQGQRRQVDYPTDVIVADVFGLGHGREVGDLAPFEWPADGDGLWLYRSRSSMVECPVLKGAYVAYQIIP